MCHLILMLPVVALPVFWFLPLTVAAPVYGAASTLAGIVYYHAWKTGRSPVQIGRERLCGATGIVVALEPALRVKVDGDIWQARCSAPLVAGDKVCVERLEGLTLRVAGPTHAAKEVR